MTTDEKSCEILMGHIEAGLQVLARIEAHLDSFMEGDGKTMGRTPVSAVVVADALSRYYTAAETLFFRVARVFENSVEGNRWHAELLDRMGMEIPGIRPAVLSAATQSALRDLMRFRHFSRYYVELEYDWDRLDFLLGKFQGLRPALRDDLHRFRALLADATKAE